MPATNWGIVQYICVVDTDAQLYLNRSVKAVPASTESDKKLNVLRLAYFTLFVMSVDVFLSSETSYVLRSLLKAINEVESAI